MTVAELIEALSKLDPTLRVVTNAYEGGYDDVKSESLNPFVLALNVNDPEHWWYGPHEIVQEDMGYHHPTKDKVQAICL